MWQITCTIKNSKHDTRQKIKMPKIWPNCEYVRVCVFVFLSSYWSQCLHMIHRPHAIDDAFHENELETSISDVDMCVCVYSKRFKHCYNWCIRTATLLFDYNVGNEIIELLLLMNRRAVNHILFLGPCLHTNTNAFTSLKISARKHRQMIEKKHTHYGLKWFAFCSRQFRLNNSAAYASHSIELQCSIRGGKTWPNAMVKNIQRGKIGTNCD